MKVIYSGLESSGKSYQLAIKVGELARRNHKWLKKQQAYYDKNGPDQFLIRYGFASPIARPLWSNLQFSKEFEDYYVRELGLPPIQYWTNLQELIKCEHADVIIDEVGNYFDSRMWSELSLDVRRWLTQGAKSGVELYGSAQDFAQVDKAFRRLVNHLFHVTKLFGNSRPSATKPPIRYIWGAGMMAELDPQGYDEDKKKFKGQFALPHIFFFHREYCEMFDTTQKIVRSKLPPLRHVDYYCELETCSFHKQAHV